LLVLHGGPGAHHDYLLPQMLHLAERYDLLFYDQRGGGRSKPNMSDHIDATTHLTDLAAVIAEFSLASPSIVGYSWGGMLALLYLISTERDPTLPKPARLALIDPAPLKREYRRRFEAEFAARQNGPRITAMRDELAASDLRLRDPDAYRQRTFELAVAAYFADPARAQDLTPFRVSARVLESVWESLGAEYDIIADLPSARCPTLFVHGRDDPIPVASSSEAAQVMHADLVVLDDCGHVPYVEQPGKLFAALDQFLAADNSNNPG